MYTVLEKIADEVSKRALRGNHLGRTITLKFKYFDFEQHTRSKTIDDFINDKETILNEAFNLLSTPEYPEKPIRLLGITLNNLGEKKPEPAQLTIGF